MSKRATSATTSGRPHLAVDERQAAADRARSAIEAAGGLVTPIEIAAEWEITQQALSDRIARGTFPEPVKVAGRVRLYLRAEIELYREAATPAGAATAAALKARRAEPTRHPAQASSDG